MTGPVGRGALARVYFSPFAQVPLQAGAVLGVLALVRKGLIKPVLAATPLSEPTATGLGGFLSFAALLGIYVLAIRFLERRRTRDLALRPALRESAIGALYGAAMMGAVVGIIAPFGGYRVISRGSADVLVSASGMILLLAAVEEILFRGILFRQLMSRWGLAAAFVISALLFGGLHFTGGSFHLAGFLSATLGGLWMCALYVATGGRLGPEASIVALVLLAINVVALLRLIRRRRPADGEA